LQGAMGLAVLPYMETILLERKRVVDFYNENLDLSQIQTLKIRANTQWNYSYYPIILKDESTLLRVQKVLNDLQIFPRRYFYPSLNKINYIKITSMPVSESIASRILCLPLYVDLQQNDIQQIVSVLNSNL
jgi:dTDP-4-amino-4,6-dideoxygalactose transaminase